MFIQTIEPSMIQELWTKYGIAGLLFGILLTLLITQGKKSDKRIADLETQQEEAYKQNLQNHKEMIDEYVVLVKGNNEVVSKLTSCLEVIKDSLGRVERNQEKDTGG